jgi:catechol 2,3-dioxygenase-like lactoylglutathione lyase family enzyme
VLDHVGVPVSDFERSKRFYTEALSPLGYELIMEPSVSAAGFGRWGKPDFWISQGEPGQAFHIAFAADDRFSVDAFHEAAMAAGGRDNGGPGLRPEYHASYYGAFVFDPDGNNIEAVCHGQEQEASKMPDSLFARMRRRGFCELRLYRILGSSLPQATPSQGKEIWPLGVYTCRAPTSILRVI